LGEAPLVYSMAFWVKKSEDGFEVKTITTEGKKGVDCGTYK